MAIIKTQAIVLKTKAFRETSLIATLLTESNGRIQVLVKGIRSKNNRYNSCLQPLTLNKIVFYQKKKSDLHLATQCELIKRFEPLHKDLVKMAYASFCLEIIDRTTQENDPNAELFRLLVDTLRQICTQKDAENPALVFQVRALHLLGFMPQLKFCSCCGREVKIHTPGVRIHALRECVGKFSFSPESGGLVCGACLRKDSKVQPISKGALASLLHIGGKEWEGIGRFNLSKKIIDELKKPILDFTREHTQAELRTLEFIEKIQSKQLNG